MELTSNAKKRVAIYLRVSTQDQSTDLQRSELIEFVDLRGWQVVGIYEDVISGTTANRPSLKLLLADIRSRKVDILVIWKLDRLFRSLKNLVTTIQELSELNVEFVSLRDQVDLTTSTGRLMLHLLGAFGEFEAALIKERVNAGLRSARAKGKRLGRPKKIDHSKVIQLRQQGMSLRQIAENIGASKSAVHKSLTKGASQPNEITKARLRE